MSAVHKLPSPPDLFDRAAIALIEREPDPEVRAELRERYELRAALAQFQGGMSRPNAERLAFRSLRQVLGLRD